MAESQLRWHSTEWAKRAQTIYVKPSVCFLMANFHPKQVWNVRDNNQWVSTPGRRDPPEGGPLTNPDRPFARADVLISCSVTIPERKGSGGTRKKGPTSGPTLLFSILFMLIRENIND